MEKIERKGEKTSDTESQDMTPDFKELISEEKKQNLHEKMD